MDNCLHLARVRARGGGTFQTMPGKAAHRATRGQEIETVLRRYIRSPYCIGTALALALFDTFFVPGGLLMDVPLWQRAAIHLFDTVIFLGHSYVVLPRAFRLALDRGWPVLGVHVAVYLPLALILAAAFALVETQALSGIEFLWDTCIIVSWVVLSAVIGLFLFWVVFLPYTGIDVTPDQIWSFRRDQGCRLQEHLSPEVRGRVLHILAENQYVRVITEAGEELIRMTLSEAAALVPEDAGLRVHRSHWVARDRVAGFQFERGNPKLTTIDGARIPVSRKRVDAVRRLLSLRET